MNTKFNEIKKWKVESENVEYTTPIFTLKSKQVKSQLQDKSGNFYVIEAPDWVNILALTEKPEVILVQQYRHGIEEITWEIPGGAVDAEDQSAREAAVRELKEETGFTSEKWEDLGKVSSNPAIFNNYCHFYVAHDCVHSVAQNFDTFEEIRVITVSLDEFLELIKNGHIHHSLIVAAMAKFLLNR